MQNGIPDSYTTLPEPVIDREELVEEQKAIKYLKSAEWKLIKDYFEERKKFYQSYLPNGLGLNETALTKEQIGERWMIADAVIAEFDMLINSFEVKAGNGRD